MSIRRLIVSNNQRICSSFLQKTRNFSAISSSHPIIAPPINPCSSPKTRTFSSSRILKEFCPGYDKRYKRKGDVDLVMEDMWPIVKPILVSELEAAIDALSKELTKLRTGKASIGMLDHIFVKARGVQMDLNRLALVTIVDRKTLAVTTHDPDVDMIRVVRQAIGKSPLGLNPKSVGQRIIVAVPPLTKEHILAINKVVTKSTIKRSIRIARQEAVDAIRRVNYPLERLQIVEKNIDELTKKYIKSAEDMCEAREKELSASTDFT